MTDKKDSFGVWMGEYFCPVCGEAVEGEEVIVIPNTISKANKIRKKYGEYAKLPLGLSKNLCKTCDERLIEHNSVFILEAKENPSKDEIPFTGRHVEIERKYLQNVEENKKICLMKQSEFKELFDKNTEKTND